MLISRNFSLAILSEWPLPTIVPSRTHQTIRLKNIVGFASSGLANWKSAVLSVFSMTSESVGSTQSEGPRLPRFARHCASICSDSLIEAGKRYRAPGSQVMCYLASDRRDADCPVCSAKRSFCSGSCWVSARH